MTQRTPTPEELISADLAYSEQEFTFTFNRKDIGSIVASLAYCCRTILRHEPFERGLCEDVLAKIEGHRELQQSKKPLGDFG